MIPVEESWSFPRYLFLNADTQTLGYLQTKDKLTDILNRDLWVWISFFKGVGGDVNSVFVSCWLQGLSFFLERQQEVFEDNLALKFFTLV